MSSEDPKLLNEIRSLKYGIIFAACVIAFAISITTNRGDVGAIASLIIGFSALVGGVTTRYLRK
jgi:hypothetical protein